MKKQFFLQYTLTVTILLILVVTWEFFIEDNIPSLIFKENIEESNIQHWEYVLTVGTFSALALIVPTIISVWHANKRLQAELDVQKERLEVFKATMRTVQDIVGNFLHSLQFIRIRENEQNVTGPDSLELMDSLIHETSEKLTKLSNLDTIHEKQMATGDGIDYEVTAHDEGKQSQSEKH